MPEVRSAGFTYAGPLLALVDTFGVFVPQGRTVDEMRDRPAPHIRAVSHDYLQTMGVRLLAGRWFEAKDDAPAPPVIIVNRTVMQRFFDNENPVGQMVHLDGRMGLPPQQITGVVEDMRQGRLDQEPSPQLFVDYRQVLALTQARNLPTPVQERLAFGFYSFVVRTDRDPATLAPAVRSLIIRSIPRPVSTRWLPMEELVRCLADTSALLCIAPRDFCGHRDDTGGGRHLRGIGICRGPAHSGVRRPPGAGSAAARHSGTGLAPRDPSDGARHPDRSGRRGCAHAGPWAVCSSRSRRWIPRPI